MNDKDWMRSQNKDYRDGYHEGRNSMLKQCAAAIIFVGMVLWLII